MTEHRTLAELLADEKWGTICDCGRPRCTGCCICHTCDEETS